MEDEIFGDASSQDVEVQERATISRRKRRKTAPQSQPLRKHAPAPSPQSDSEPGEEDEGEGDDGNMSLCFVCDTVITDDPKTLNGHQIHSGPCWNATRSYRRLMSGSPAALKRADDMMHNNAGQWKHEVQGLLRQPGQRRDGAARARLKMVAKEVQQAHRSHESMDTHIILNKRRYAAYHKLWDDWGSDTADEQFSQDLITQNRQWCTSGEERVSVKEPARIRSRTGTSQLILNEFPLDEPAPSNSQPSRPERIYRRDSDDDDDDRGSTTSRATRASKTPNKSPRPKDNSTTDDPNSTRQAMMRRSREKQRMEDIIAIASGPRSVAAKLTAALTKLSDDKRAGMEVDPNTVVADVQSATTHVSTLLGEIHSVKPSQLDDFKATVDGAIIKLQVALKAAGDSLDGVRFLNAETSKDSKKGKNSACYLRTKLVAQLVKGGFPKLHAKTFFDKLENWAPDLSIENPKTADASNMYKFCRSADPVKCQNVINALDSDMKAASDAFAEKKNVLLKSMVSNAKWQGAMTKTELPFNDLASVKLFPSAPDNPLYSPEPGFDAWLLCSKPRGWRCGPKNLPLPGIACIFLNASAKLSCYLQVIGIDGLLSHGIAVSDVAVFLDSPSGSKYFADTATLMKLEPGQAAYCPAGLLVIPVVLNEPEAPASSDSKASQPSASDAKKNAGDDLGFLIHIPLMYKAFHLHTRAQVVAAVADINTRHLEKNKSIRLWAPRYEVMKTFLAEITTVS